MADFDFLSNNKASNALHIFLQAYSCEVSASSPEMMLPSISCRLQIAFMLTTLYHNVALDGIQPEMASSSTSGRHQIATLTRSFWVLLRSRFRDKRTTDLETVESFVKCDSSA